MSQENVGIVRRMYEAIGRNDLEGAFASQDETHRKNVTGTPPDEAAPGDRAPSSIAFLLSQIGTYASRRFAERLAAIDLQPPLFRVMNIVDAGAGLSQQAIGAAIQAPASRMVAIRDELEERGLVERRPQPGDRRVHALHLTPGGERLVAVLQRIVEGTGLGLGVHPGLSHGRRDG